MVVKSKLVELQTGTSGKQDRPFDSIMASTAKALCNEAWPGRYISINGVFNIQRTGTLHAADMVHWNGRAPEALAGTRSMTLPSRFTRIASLVVRALQRHIDSKLGCPKGEAYEMLEAVVRTLHSSIEGCRIRAWILHTLNRMRYTRYICAEDAQEMKPRS
jgi:hypothetical protein